MAIVYRPPDAWLHFVAAAWNEPDGSGKTYQFSRTAPFPEEPQPAHSAAATTAAKVAVMCGLRTVCPSLDSRLPVAVRV